MIRINLLTEGRGAKKGGGAPGPRPVATGGGEGAPPWPLYIVILFLFVLTALAYGGWLFLQNRALEKKIAEQQVELKKYEGAREKVAELEKKKVEYTSKLDQIKQLKDQQSVPVKLMNRLVEVLPDGCWYTSALQAGQGITLVGKAKSIKTISTLYDNLVATSEFGQIQLGDVAQQAAGNGEEIYAYKVSFNYYPGGVQPKPVETAPAPAKKPAARPPKASADSGE